MQFFVGSVLLLAGLQACMSLNIVEKATELGATTLVSFLQRAGLNGTLAGEGPFTVFAPSNEAFGALDPDLVEELENDVALLQSVLQYHVLSGSVLSSALTNDMLVDSLETGKQIRINIYGNKVLATGCEVVSADQSADNGVIHVVSKVMMAPTLNVVEFAVADSRFSELVRAVTAAGLGSALQGPDLTVFAPTNTAFDAVDNLEEIIANVTLLTSILTYHVVPSTVYSAGLSNDQKVTTLQGQELTVSISEAGVVGINDATVAIPNVAVTNGVIHAIDMVLVPATMPPPTEDPNSASAVLPSAILAIVMATIARFF